MIDESRRPAKFIRCLPFVLAEECPFPRDWSNPRNFSNDRNDPGGATMCGIIQREYDHFRKSRRLHTQPVIQISEFEGRWIYYNWYWMPHSGLLPSGLDLSFFDSAVNEGSTEANKILQFALGLVIDGVWGPKTAGVVGMLTPSTAPAVISSFANRRREVYHETGTEAERESFLHGWLARADSIEKTSLEMAGG